MSNEMTKKVGEAMKCGQSMTPRMSEQGCQAEVLTPEQLRIRNLERDSDILHNDCIIEIAVRNRGVLEYMEHWEGRALKAESSLAEAVAALKAAARLIEDEYCAHPGAHAADNSACYADFIHAIIAKHSG